MRRRSAHSIACTAIVFGLSASAWAGDRSEQGNSGDPAAQALPTQALPTQALIDTPVDPQGSLPEEGKDLRIDEKVGEQIPLDIPFVDSDGKQVTLAEYVAGDLPVILTFNYSSCPMLCNSQLNGLIDAMEQTAFSAGDQYRIVTIGIDHMETPTKSAETKAKYVSEFQDDKKDSVRRGWNFLTGEKDAIRSMANSVGFPFRKLDDSSEYAHPASLIFLSPTGVVTRYYHGIYYEPQTFSKSIFQAGAGEHGVSVGFLLACLRPSHKEGYAEAGVAAMRYGALGFVLLLLAAFGTWQMMRTRSARQEQVG